MEYTIYSFWTNKYYGELFKVKEVDKVVKMDMDFYRNYFEPNETYGNKKMREIKNLEYENKEMRGGKTRQQSRMECVELSLVAVNDSVEEPYTYEKSWNCENINHRENGDQLLLRS